MIVTENIKILPTFIVAYPQFYEDNGQKLRRGNVNIREVSNAHHNIVSTQAQKKVEKAINYTVLMSKTKKCYNPVTSSTFKFKISFITLTLSSAQEHTDCVIKEKLLQPFLQQLRQKYNVKYYVWKAERQRNGRIHFHIVCNEFIHWKSLQKDWNKIQDSLHYIKNYHTNRESIKSFPSSKEDYFNVNSTDIHSVRKVRDLGKYLCKYFNKEYSKNRSACKRNECGYNSSNIRCTVSVSEGAKRFLKSLAKVGRLWSCSENLSRANGVSEVVNLQLSDELFWLRKQKGIEVFEAEYCTVIKVTPVVLREMNLTGLYSLFEEHCKLIFDDIPE